jgi:hypothetical protein
VSEELRELERAVAERGGAAERLRLASALERMGRRDDALAVLVPAREDADVRRAIGRFPAWTHPHADAGESGAADVEPIRVKPRIKWKAAAPNVGSSLVATAFAVLAAGTSPPRRKVFDAETGDLLCEAASPALGLVGDLVLELGRMGLEAYDLWTGEPVWEVEELPRQPVLAFDRCGVVAVTAEDRVVTFETGDPRISPLKVRDDVVAFDVSGRMRRCLLAPDRIVFEWRSGAVILDRASFAVIARVPGRPLRIEDGALVVAGREGIVDFDLATGRQLETRLHRLTTLALDGPPSLVVRARDVFYETDRTKLFAQVGGTELWRMTAGELPSWPIHHLAAVSRRLVAAGRETVFCLESPS